MYNNKIISLIDFSYQIHNQIKYIIENNPFLTLSQQINQIIESILSKVIKCR